MTQIDTDQRSPQQRIRDEEIAEEPLLPPLQLQPDTIALPMETHLQRPRRHPLALAGVVENGVVHFLDAGVKLPEHSRVIIVAESA